MWYPLKQKLKRIAKINNQQLPTNYKKILKQYTNAFGLRGKKNIFLGELWRYKVVIANCDDFKIPHGYSLLPGIILINAQWAYKLIFDKSEEKEIAFKATVGHEYGHKMQHLHIRNIKNSVAFDKKCKHLNKADKRFIKWANEVHCDFYGAKEVLCAKKNSLTISYNYKDDCKAKCGVKDEKTHPSWKMRKRYAEFGKYNAKLLEMIAEDVKESFQPIKLSVNEKVVNAVWDFYKREEIVLEPDQSV